VPEIVWRCGIDLNLIDVSDCDALRWLECCVWPDQPERLARLRAAVEVARREPPRVVRGDLIDDLERVAAEAPTDATLVLYHSAVLPYVSPERRREFCRLAAEGPWVWLSMEGRGVIETLQAPREPPHPDCGLLACGPRTVLAFGHMHGRWIEWA
jgi:hypothetical protein